MDAQPQKSFFKRFWWVGIIIVICIIGFFIYSNQQQKNEDAEKERQKQAQIKNDQTNQNQGYQYVDPLMTAAQLEKANLVLAMGVTIDDPENDFAVSPVGPVGLDGKTDNPQGYQLHWNDIKKVTLGADQENFYIRYDFYGTIPTTMVTVTGDDIKSIACNIGLSKFTTTSGTTDEGMWQVGLMFAQQRGDDSKDESVGYDVITPRIGLTSIATPTPTQDKYGETMYATSSSDGAVSGGAGSDYIIALFPLANLRVAPGTDITFDIGVETNSRTYHHSSIDPLLDFGSAKSGKIITYILGSNTYTSVKPDYK
jgi:hypothetical protein